LSQFTLRSIPILLALAIIPAPPAKADKYPEISDASLAALTQLLPERPAGFGVPCANRDAWTQVAPLFQRSIERADAFIAKPLPPWSDGAYLTTSRTGDRSKGEGMINAHDGQLPSLVLAECSTYTGKYLPRLIEQIDAISAQRSWTLPAHDLKLDSFSGRHHFVDLGAADRGHTLAEALYLLGDRLPAPVRQRAMAALELNLFAPMRQSLSGINVDWWLHAPNNWNAVCLDGAVGAALTVLPDRKDRALFAAAGSLYSGKYFLKSFRDSGFADEGIGYWTYGFSNYMELREQLWLSTKGKLDLYDNPRARRAALFGFEFQMLPGVYASYADAHFMSGPGNFRLAMLDLIFGLGIFPEPAKIVHDSADGGSLTGAVLAAFPLNDPWHGDSATEADLRSLQTWYGDVGVLVSRPSPGAVLAVTIKDGGNSNHSHNDIGSFSIGLAGTQVVGEPGGPHFYTVDTFNSKRYDSRLLNSFGHPVPQIDGKLQIEAPLVQPKVIDHRFSDTADSVSFDMTGAYKTPILKKLTRTLVYTRTGTGSADITDDFDISRPTEIVESLPTHGICTQINGKTLRFDFQKAHLLVTIEGPATFSLSHDQITDYGESVDRVGAHIQLQQSGKVTMHFIPAT
jgi:hypothetical protein